MKKFILLSLLSLLSILSTYSSASNDAWISLFDGQSLHGWQANERPDSWIVKDGAIVTNGERSHLFYVGEVAQHNFKNFVFSAKVKTETGANSGIYIHTQLSGDHWPSKGYELQVYNARPAPSEGYIERKMTGSIYAVRNTWQTHVKDNEWFDYTIIVSGKTIETYINGQLICEYTESSQPWRAQDKLKRLLSSGTFALQAHDPNSVVHYKDLKVKLLEDDAPTLGTALNNPSLNQLVSKFANDNMPLIDLGANDSQAKVIARQLGFSIIEPTFATTNTTQGTPMLLEINDSKHSVSPELLKNSAKQGVKVVFRSDNLSEFTAEQLTQRLTTIQQAQLSWGDFWVPQ